MLKKTFAVLFFSSLSLLSTSVWPRTRTHTHVQLDSYTSVHVQAVYSQLLQECLTYVKDMFSLTTGHFIIVKHTDIEQQTHVLDWSLGTILKVLWEIFPHPALNRKKSLGKSRKLIFSLPPCCLFLELLQHMSPIPDYTLSRRPCHSVSSDQTPKPLSRLLLPRRTPPHWGLANLYGDATA